LEGSLYRGALGNALFHFGNCISSSDLGISLQIQRFWVAQRLSAAIKIQGSGFSR
jgi:hypothetical protein